ncbi:MAG: macro domain-containing protein [Candidatus Methanarcanum hacksteinii]|nr:macro domain-containing protein [Candidatus Methanarcanum hacksteinii]
MIKEEKITVFNSNCDAIVNTVNCRGVMGAGLALEFKLRYPDMFEQYVEDCSNGSVKIGELKTYDAENVLIVNFPTKDHWREPSELWYIEKGLDYLVKLVKQKQIPTGTELPSPNDNISVPIGLVKTVEHYLGSTGILDFIPLKWVVLTRNKHSLMMRYHKAFAEHMG